VPAYQYSTGSKTYYCHMGEGANNAGVGVLQRALNVCYDENLTQDNVFGSKTREALKRAQADEKIGVDGKYGNETMWALDWTRWRDGAWRCAPLTGG
jgi:hypothetical protein